MDRPACRLAKSTALQPVPDCCSARASTPQSPTVPQRSKAFQIDMHASERASILAELTPPFTLLQPGRAAGAGRVLLAAFGPHLSQGLPGGLAARCRTPCANPRIATSMSCSSRWWPRRAADRRALPARLSRRQSRALRARSRAVSPAGCRSSPIPSRRAWWAGSAPSPASWPTPRRSTASGCRSAPPSSASSGFTGRSTRPWPICWRRPASASASPFSSIATRCRRPPWASRPAGGRISCSATASAPPATPSSPASCATCCRRAGYEVQVNRPYAGGFITEYYGNPGARRAVPAARDQPRPLSRRGDALQEQGLPETGARAQRIWRRRCSRRCRCCSSGGRPPNRVCVELASVILLYCIAIRSVASEAWQCQSLRGNGKLASRVRLPNASAKSCADENKRGRAEDRAAQV